MNAFDSARRVETKGLAILLPYLRDRAHDGQLVVTSKGTLAPFLQGIIGDAVFNSDAETMWTVEIKVEERHTGNLFLEFWSNRNLRAKGEHAERGQKVGWMVSQRADLLFYYFLDADRLYVFDLFKLKRWFFGHDDRQPALHNFRLVSQSRYVQRNDTCGYLVPLDVLGREVGFRLLHPRQIPLWQESVA